MADNWYYVQKGNRHGPVAIEVIEAMLAKQELKDEDYVWKKGFENWKKVKDVGEFNVMPASIPSEPKIPDAPKPVVKELSLKDINEDEKILFIRIGNDRGMTPSDYGPFNLKQLKQLFNENRINGKTMVFAKGMKEYKILGELPEYEDIFNEKPPVIPEAEKRSYPRKPFVARMFVQNNKKVFEGVCRDVSVGGMQVLMDEFTGKAGDKVSINVHPENSEYHFVASGLVVRILEGNSGFSFRFQGLSDEAKRSIEKYLQE